MFLHMFWFLPRRKRPRNGGQAHLVLRSLWVCSSAEGSMCAALPLQPHSSSRDLGAFALQLL